METPDEADGYYRLAFGGEETACIDYHATGDVVQASTEGVRLDEGETTEGSAHVCVCVQPSRTLGTGRGIACVPQSFLSPVLGMPRIAFSVRLTES